MSRKTIIWIVGGVLAAAVVAVVGIVSYHLGFTHGAGSGAGGVVRRLRVLPAGNGVSYHVVGVRAFPGLGLLFVVLVAIGVGALIVYFVGPGRKPAAVSAIGHAQTPGSGPYDAGWQEYQQWQQFEQWHQRMHAPTSPEAPTVPLPPQAETLPNAPTPPDAPTQDSG